MMPETQEPEINLRFHRLIALWVIVEAFAGGMLHALKIPFTGMIVSSLAVFCILLIGYFVPNRNAIAIATVVVALFKLMLSPHSPPTAYIAVFFQGALGSLVFRSSISLKSKAITLAVFSLAESALQRILVLVILYGNSFWNALDGFIQKLLGSSTNPQYSLWIASSYVLLHVIGGLVVGVYSTRLILKSQVWKTNLNELQIPANDLANATPVQLSKKRRKATFVNFLFITLIVMYLLSLLFPDHLSFPKQKIVAILIRASVLLAVWYVVVSPLLMLLLRRYLERKRSVYAAIINAVTNLLPQTRFIFLESWRRSSEEHGIDRIKLFMKTLMVNVI
jgi:hypothetical protein